ncbi:hypothetical protein [Actinomadura sp. GTD37]|uniref:hypothetical protein n=1 Tax=Actinomadura sp. GTD37 TaxID=1778030 RepID=UPI0035C0A477
MRLLLNLFGAAMILLGAAGSATVSWAAAAGKGDGLDIASVPLNLTALGLAALGAGALPPRWRGEPQRREIDLDGTRTAALVFPYMRRPVICVLAGTVLFALAATYALVLASLNGGPPQVSGAAVFLVVAAWGAQASARQLRSPKYVALTPDLLSFRAPDGRLDVPWRDIAELTLADRGVVFFCRIEPHAGARDPYRDRAMRRVHRREGIDVISVSGLTCHPERLFIEMRTYLPSADPTF